MWWMWHCSYCGVAKPMDMYADTMSICDRCQKALNRANFLYQLEKERREQVQA